MMTEIRVINDTAQDPVLSNGAPVLYQEYTYDCEPSHSSR